LGMPGKATRMVLWKDLVRNCSNWTMVAAMKAMPTKQRPTRPMVLSRQLLGQFLAARNSALSSSSLQQRCSCFWREMSGTLAVNWVREKGCCQSTKAKGEGGAEERGGGMSQGGGLLSIGCD